MMLVVFLSFSLCFLVFDYLYMYMLYFFLFIFVIMGYVMYFDGIFCLDFFSIILLVLLFCIFMYSFLLLFVDFGGMLVFFFMFFFCLVSFFSVSCFVFYFSFELVFLLMFFFLLGWGNSMERLQASFYMFFYTMVFSLPFLFFLVDLNYFFSGCFCVFNFFFYGDLYSFFVFFVFSVKLPIFGFHLWLPKAHVEAPLAGSMVLAGVLLKLGGYGIFRFFFLLSNLSYYNSFLLNFLFYLSLLGSIFAGLVCMRQLDLKMMIAYSSVVHMCAMYMGLASFSIWGLWGSFFMMMGHGYVSSVLFYLMAYFYLMFHSRSNLVLKGAVVFSSFFCLLWFFSCLLNLGFPPFMTFFSEICIFISLDMFTLLEWMMIFISCMLVGMYCIFLYVYLSHGDALVDTLCFLDMKLFILVFSHLYYVFIFILISFN